MAQVLFWDLRTDATRVTLLNQTLAALLPDERKRVIEQRDTATIPYLRHHNLAEVCKTIENLEVSDRVKLDMRSIYQLLAEAESVVHNCTLDQTHFHEVGNAKAVRNTLGICLAIEAVSPGEIVATHVQTGRGFVQCEHGKLPVPAPATVVLIERGIPVCEHTLDGERLTPTSAAIILHFVDKFTS